MTKIYLDELTGCYNRRFLHHWIGDEIKRARRYATKFSLLLLDIDNYRDINNNFGHLEGDKVLIDFAEFLQSNIRESDSLVRYGGDEFVILMPNTNSKGAIELAQRLLTSLNETEILNHKIRCSIGFSVYPDDGQTAEVLFNQADNLMYQAKKQGKNRIGLKEKIIRKLKIPSPITIGRKNETNWCLDQIDDFNTIFVAGETGVGKTRLVLEVKDQLDNTIFLRANAYAALSSVPYHPFKNMFNELVNKYYAIVQRVFKQMPEIYQAEVMKLLPTEEGFKKVQTQDLDKYRLYNAVTEFILKIAQTTSPNTTMLLFDDLHWIDRPSCELMDFLIRSIKNNVKVFGTYRVEEIRTSQFADFKEIWARERFYSEITVEPLNEEQSYQLLKAIMVSVPKPAAEFIYHESGGNPFFIEEILRELERQKKLYWSGNEWIFVKQPGITIPRSVDETIKRKLKFLDPETKKFLDIAAVFGQEFVAEIITMASNRNVGEILQSFDEFSRLGFIKERTDENFFFSEDIVRQVVYKNIPRANLVKYHKLIGETIEHFYRGSLQNYFEQLALHFTIANDSQKALEYSKKAALKAKENYAYDVAIKFFENALKYEKDDNEIYSLKLSLADIYFWTGEYTKAIQELDACLKIKPDAYEVYENLGRVCGNMGDYTSSLKYYRQGLKLAKGTDAIYTFRLAITSVYMRLGQFHRAQKELEDILRYKEKMKRKDVCFAHLRLGTVFFSLDKLNKAENFLKTALKIARAIDDKNYIAACYQDLALCYRRKFNMKACENYLKKALQIDEEIGYLGGIVIARINLGALFSNYNLSKAEEYYLKGLSAAKLIGAKMDMVLLYSNLGSIYKHRLMDDQSFNNFKQSLKLAKQIHYEEGIISANLSLSECYRNKGKIKKSKQHLKSAQNIAEKLDLNTSIIICMMEELDYLLETKNTKKLISVLEKLNKKLKLEHDLTLKLYGLIYCAQVMMKLKKYSKAHMYLKKAYNFVKSLPHNNITGEIYYLEGMVYEKQNKLKLAKKMFSQARRIFETVGNLRYLDRIEEEMTKIDKKQM